MLLLWTYQMGEIPIWHSVKVAFCNVPWSDEIGINLLWYSGKNGDFSDFVCQIVSNYDHFNFDFIFYDFCWIFSVATAFFSRNHDVIFKFHGAKQFKLQKESKLCLTGRWNGHLKFDIHLGFFVVRFQALSDWPAFAQLIRLLLLLRYTYIFCETLCKNYKKKHWLMKTAVTLWCYTGEAWSWACFEAI